MLLRQSYLAQRYLVSMSNLADISKLNIESIVEPGALFKMHVKGHSMLPLLGFGDDEIVLRRTYTEDEIMGRIAMFRADDGHIIVHRVIDVSNGIVTLRGDGNLLQCERCKREEIIGVVESVVRSSGESVSCTTRSWRRKERIWLGTPRVVRRYALAILRRLSNIKRKKRR